MNALIRNKCQKYVIMAVVFTIQFTICSNYSYGQNIDKGIRYIELNQLNHAKGFFINALNQNPKNSQLYRYLGDIYFRLNRLDSAEYYYNKGIEANKEDAYNYAGLVKLMIKKGNQAELTPNLDKALKLTKSSKDAAFFVYLADCYFVNNNFDKALSYLEKAKDINKKLPEIYIERGDIYLSQSKSGEGANEFENALFYSKDVMHNVSARAYYELGKIYMLAWNYDEALNAFNNVLKLDSNYIPVYKDLGELYYRANKNKDAANAYAKYISKSEVTNAEVARYAQMLYFSNNYLKSSQFIDKFLKVDSNNFILLRLQTYNCYELGEYQKGLKAITKMLKLINKDNKLITSDYDYYAKLLIKNNKDSLAIINYLIEIKLDSTKSGYYEDIAKIYEKQNKYAKAIVYYEKFLKSRKKPEVNDYYQLAKTCYIVISDPTVPVDFTTEFDLVFKGDSACAKVIELLPDKYNGYLYRARINAILDKEFDYETGFAKLYYEQALEKMEPTADKFKKEIIEAYSYLGYYYFIIDDKNKSKEYWGKILAVDPTNDTAQKAIKGLTKPRIPKKQDN